MPFDQLVSRLGPIPQFQPQVVNRVPKQSAGPAIAAGIAQGVHNLAGILDPVEQEKRRAALIHYQLARKANEAALHGDYSLLMKLKDPLWRQKMINFQLGVQARNDAHTAAIDTHGKRVADEKATQTGYNFNDIGAPTSGTVPDRFLRPTEVPTTTPEDYYGTP